jgi:phosphopantothenoylcysteine decarboxylase / phosphopantothenate---cysteine ligase
MILLGVTGSIAAYKAVEILRLLLKAKQDVHVVMTSAASRFIGPLTFQAISGHPVFVDPLDPAAYQMAHLALSEKASVILVAPASADTLSRLASGRANDLVCATVLAARRAANGHLKTPVLIAPAMHESMWRHPATQANVKTLEGFGYEWVGPIIGPLGRTGDVGVGRLSEPSDIVGRCLKLCARQ